MMNTNEQYKRKGLIAKIKIAQSQLGMEDDVYRAMLARGMSNDAIKDQKKFMEGAIDTFRTAKMIEAISKSRERPT